MCIINRCSQVNQVNDNIKGNTTGCEGFEKLVQTGSICVFVFDGYMLVVMILQSINTVQNNFKKRSILL